MSFEEEDIFMMAEEKPTPEQWDFVNEILKRQISTDICAQGLWDSLLEQHQPLSQTTQFSIENISEESETAYHPEPIVRVRRPSTKSNDSNYEKNICAYITKKTVQCFLSSTYRRKVQKLCTKYGCDYSEVVAYYSKRYKEVFGITHLTLLITPETEEEIEMKQAFTEFLRWFLRERYMLYLLKNGKMSEKEKYVEFKNKYLLFVQKTEQKFSIC